MEIEGSDFATVEVRFGSEKILAHVGRLIHVKYGVYEITCFDFDENFHFDWTVTALTKIPC